MLGVALAAAAFAWWWNYQRGHQSLEFYGSETARLVRTAEQVELLELEPQDSSTGSPSSPLPAAQSLMVEGQPHAVVRRADISQAKGLLHARSALLDDASYNWKARPSDATPSYSHAVRFSDGNRNAILAFDLTNRTVSLPESSRRATLIPKIVSGWQIFINRHFPAD